MEPEPSDLLACPTEPQEKKQQQRAEAVENDPLVALARRYTRAAHRLVKALDTASLTRAWTADLLVAIDGIRWLSTPIASKTFRAVSGVASDDGSADEVEADANGSAKVARLMIAESRDAWRLVLAKGEAPPGTPLEHIVVMLDQLDASLQERFPRAMEFGRPGIDTHEAARHDAPRRG